MHRSLAYSCAYSCAVGAILGLLSQQWICAFGLVAAYTMDGPVLGN